MIAELRKRITTLELELEESNRYRHSSSTAPSFDSSSTVSTSRASSKARENAYYVSSFIPGSLPRVAPHEQLPEYSLHPDDPLAKQDSDTAPLDELSYEAMSAHAHLALGHHGEFIGRGSLVCALHSVTSGTGPRFMYAKSTDAVSGFRDTVQPFSAIPLATTIEQLIAYLPSMLVVESLTNAFMTECNWRYGIPERWFRGARAQMWLNISQPRSSCPDQLNANWLMLLFAMMASAPQSAYDHVGQYSPVRISDDYFMCATMARRFAEDEYLNMPNASLMVSAADGTVLNCIASIVLASYLTERGRVSEAWKLVGNGIRNAEAVGMHRDPEWKLWQMMSADEKVLRRKAWWGLFIFDK
ncbi:hypothetical protein CVT24_004078 [Panaeolus cyanescens]|uniref:Xylanolytic transcriptional activator regulatory domain-containing protein n=1 Tax=Panaeolus cyanescens TaxID=181874 RepID=A0A409Y600_9AGAR|nr:hypothetical protein CVT24_004078 [Panaeolus cyanescens]